MSKSNIEWTDRTWNPVTGCTKVSPGCTNCYAKRDWARLQHLPRYNRPFEQVECHPDRLHQPLHWRKPSKIFVCHNGDLFHESVPFEFIDQVFAIMALCQQHIFQVLTKRADRMLKYFNDRREEGFTEGNISLIYGRPRRSMPWIKSLPWNNDVAILRWPLPNVWLGVSVEDQQTADERIPPLLQIPAFVRWLSIEPMLTPIDITMALEQFHSHSPFLTRNPSPVQWVVVGGESGPNARPTVIGHIREVVKQCQAASVPVFVKQLGAKPANREGQPHHISDHKGGKMSEWPTDLQVQEYPSCH